MNRAPVIFILIFAASLSGGVVEEVAPQRGRSVAPITFTDESGRRRNLSELAGFPIILLPIYTRCQTACVLNVDQLKRALGDAATDPRQFRVLLFSFARGDPLSPLFKFPF